MTAESSVARSSAKEHKNTVASIGPKLHHTIHAKGTPHRARAAEACPSRPLKKRRLHPQQDRATPPAAAHVSDDEYDEIEDRIARSRSRSGGGDGRALGRAGAEVATPSSHPLAAQCTGEMTRLDVSPPALPPLPTRGCQPLPPRPSLPDISDFLDATSQPRVTTSEPVPQQDYEGKARRLLAYLARRRRDLVLPAHFSQISRTAPQTPTPMSHRPSLVSASPPSNPSMAPVAWGKDVPPMTLGQALSFRPLEVQSMRVCPSDVLGAALVLVSFGPATGRL